MKTQEFKSIVAQKCNLSASVVDEVFAASLDTLVDALSKGQEVAFYNFGKFYVKQRRSTRRVNPVTKRVFYTKNANVSAFKPFKKFKLCVK